MNTKLLEKQNEKFYTARYDRAFKEIFLKEKNQILLKKLLEQSLKTKILSIVQETIERNQGNVYVRRKNLDALIKTEQGLIGIEMNSKMKNYLHTRNAAFQCDNYAHYTYKGKEYDEEFIIAQINYTYELGKDEEIYRIYKIQDKSGKEFVQNFLILEFNMDKIMEFWYSKDEKKIEEYKYLIMLDLQKEELEKLAREDKGVRLFMEELERVNEDPEFRIYITEEEDKEFIRNTELKQAKNEGISQGISQGILQGEKEKSIEIAKKLIALNMPIEQIMEITNLSKKEIEKSN